MNINEALDAADMGEKESLLGMYPVAARILAFEVRLLRERIAQENMDNCTVCNGSGKVSDGYEDFICLHCKLDWEELK
jgi:hypothetical protein